jgi:hypothetical protein
VLRFRVEADDKSATRPAPPKRTIADTNDGPLKPLRGGRRDDPWARPAAKSAAGGAERGKSRWDAPEGESALMSGPSDTIVPESGTYTLGVVVSAFAFGVALGLLLGVLLAWSL